MPLDPFGKCKGTDIKGRVIYTTDTDDPTHKVAQDADLKAQSLTDICKEIQANGNIKDPKILSLCNELVKKGF